MAGSNFTIAYTLALVDKFSSTSRKIASSISTLDLKIRNLRLGLQKSAESLTKFGTKASIAMTVPIVLGAKKILHASATIQQMRVQLNSLTGSIAGGAKELQFLEKTASKAPIPLTTLIQAFQSLRASGFGIKQSNSLMMDMSNVSATTGRSLNYLQWGMMRVAAQGHLTTQMLRDFKGVGIKDELVKMAAAQGHYNVNIDDMVKKGAVTTRVMVALFHNLASKGGVAYNHLAKQANTVGGAFIVLKNNLFEAAAPIGDVVASTLHLVKYMKELSAWLAKITPKIKVFAKAHPALVKFVVVTGLILAALGPIALAMAAIAFTVRTILSPINKLISLVKIGVAIFGALGATVGIVVIALLAIAAGIAYCYIKFKTFRKFVNALAKDIFNVFKTIGRFVKILLFDPIKWVYEKIKKIIEFFHKKHKPIQVQQKVLIEHHNIHTARQMAISPQGVLGGTTTHKVSSTLNVNVNDPNRVIKSIVGTSSERGTLVYSLGHNMSMSRL
jgi:hypothetical protein